MRALILAAASQMFTPLLPVNVDHDVSNWYLEPTNLKTVTGDINCKSILYVNDKFIVGGTGAKLAYGPTLESLVLSDTVSVLGGSYHINHIAYGNGIYVIGTSNGKVYTSTNLQNWTLNSQASSFIGSVVNSIKFINGEFIVTGGGATGCKSANGLNWVDIGSYLSPLYNATSAQVSGVIWDGARYVVSSGNKRIGYSSSLTSAFTSVTLPVSTTNLQDIAYNGSTYMVVGTNGVIATSNDLVNWVQDTSLAAYLGSNDIHGVIWDGFKWFIHGQGGKSAHMYPGQAWVTGTALTALVGTGDIYDAIIARGKITVATNNSGIYSTLQSQPNLDATARHYRIIIATIGSGNYAQMSEVELLDAQGNDLLNPATTLAYQSSSYGGATYNSAKLIDNLDGTKWTSDGSAPPKNEWVSFTLPAEIAPVALTIKEGAGEYQRMPRAFQFQKSVNGTDWVTIKYVSNQAQWANGEKRSYALS